MGLDDRQLQFDLELALLREAPDGEAGVRFDVLQDILGGGGRLGGAEIISADSRQVYRGMDIGTAKVAAADRARIIHHGLDLVDPDQLFTAADFQRRLASDSTFAASPWSRVDYFFRRSAWRDTEQNLHPAARALRPPPTEVLARE
mgnify:CR=1 FL=1